MKKIVTLLVTLMIGFAAYAQKVEVNAAVVTTAGNNDSKENATLVNISKWRLGEVYIVTLPQEEITRDLESESKIDVFPNPFTNLLKLNFKIQQPSEFTIAITDMAGKRTWYTQDKVIQPQQLLELHLEELDPAIYLLTVSPKNTDIHWVTKIQKQ